MSAVATGAEAVEWNLSDLYDGPDDPRIESELEETLSASQAFRERYRGKLGELSAAELNDAVAEAERIRSASTRVETYARLRQAADSSDQARGALVQKVRERNTQIETELLFFDLEWSALDDETAEQLLADPALGRYASVLRSEPPLQAVPALRARGEDLGREERHRFQCLEQVLQRAPLRAHRLPRRRAPLARRSTVAPLPADRPGRARSRRRGRHADPPAGPPDTRLRPEHDPERTRDRGSPTRLRLVDLGSESLERDPG